MYALPHSCEMNKRELLVKKNLEWLIEKRRTNPHELQRVTGVPQPTIHRILTGESTDPRTKTLQPLADFFGISVSDLRDRELSAAPGAAVPPAFDENVKPAPMGTRPIPVISAVQAGALRDMDSPYEPGDGYAIEYTDDMGLSRWTFALDIEGQSMMPEFRPGDRVIVDPEVSPNPGDFVVARNTSDQATFKKYRPRGIDHSGNMIFELVPLNDDYPTLRSDTEHLIVLGVLMEHRKKYRRS
jgi:SOS-response transcriptional repressor LexA